MSHDITVVKSIRELKKGLKHYGRWTYWGPSHTLNHREIGAHQDPELWFAGSQENKSWKGLTYTSKFLILLSLSLY